MKPEDLKAIEELLREIELTFCFSSSTSKAAPAIRALLQENKRYEEALRKLAAYDEGDVVSGSFDEPHSARVARTALGEK